jgi:transcriptional regulator with XRE-family HTH domain
MRGSTPKNLCGPRIRQLRIAREWSQADLAAECQRSGFDISREMIAWIESRRRRVDDIELKKLASIFGVPIQGLVP